MDIQPPNLNIPLVCKEHWGFLLVAVCCGITGLAAFFSPSVATVFAASSIVGLPVLLPLIFPSPVSVRFNALGDLGRLVLAVFVAGYIALSKKVLVPFVIAVIEYALP